MNLPNVEVTGAVDDIVPYAKSAFAGICSVRLAAGVQNKILEYMALGIPTITTSTGLEGLDAKPDIDILVADTPQQYIEHILNLSNDPQLATAIAKSAQEYVIDYHSWTSKLEPFKNTVDKLLS